MTTHHNKQARANTAGNRCIECDNKTSTTILSWPRPTPSHSTENLSTIMNLMSPETQRQYLAEAAKNCPEVMAALDAWHHRHLTMERREQPQFSEALAFQDQVNNAFDLINNTVKREVLSKQELDVLGRDFLEQIDELLRVIIATLLRAPRPSLTFGAKRDAMEAIREIFQLLLVHTECSEIGTWVQQRVMGFGATYLHPVLQLFNDDEVWRLMQWQVPDFTASGEPLHGKTITWLERFKHMCTEAQDCGVEGELFLNTKLAFEIMVGIWMNRDQWGRPLDRGQSGRGPGEKRFLV
ncbi:hypothetical protein V8F20_011759 [Naviculisporaceae sp. PSN 640]